MKQAPVSWTHGDLTDASKRKTIIYYFLADKYLKQQVVITNEK